MHRGAKLARIFARDIVGPIQVYAWNRTLRLLEDYTLTTIAKEIEWTEIAACCREIELLPLELVICARRHFV